MKEASPFLTILCYESAVANLRIHQEKGTQESLDDFMEIKGAVKEFDLRWKAAGQSDSSVLGLCLRLIGVYLKILEAREASRAPIT